MRKTLIPIAILITGMFFLTGGLVGYNVGFEDGKYVGEFQTEQKMKRNIGNLAPTLTEITEPIKTGKHKGCGLYYAAGNWSGVLDKAAKSPELLPGIIGNDKYGPIGGKYVILHAVGEFELDVDYPDIPSNTVRVGKVTLSECDE